MSTTETNVVHQDDAETGAWRRLLAPYRRASAWRATGQLLNTALPFALLWFLMVRSLSYSYWLTLLLAIPAAGLLTRLFVLQHDCGHGAFFPSRRANNVVGAVLGTVTLMPYAYWRRTHSMHHADSGNLDHRGVGDVFTLTVREYLALPVWRRMLYRLYRSPLVLFGLGPIYQFVLKHRLPLDTPRSWKREWASVWWSNLAITAYVTVLAVAVGWKAFLLVHGPIVLLAGSAGVWLFYVQHQFEETYWEHDPEWKFFRAGAHGSSFYDLPRVIHWLTGNIGYHHIHHLASQIPNYRLRECFRDTPSMQRVTRFTFLQSLRCARLKLWDEERQGMVGFRELRAPQLEGGVLTPGRRAATL